MLLYEEVRIGEARHTYSWGNPNEGNPDENTCHVSSGNVCHVASGGGVPTVNSKELTHVSLLDISGVQQPDQPYVKMCLPIQTIR